MMYTQEDQHQYIEWLLSAEHYKILLDTYGDKEAKLYLAKLKANPILQIKLFRENKARIIEQDAITYYNDPEPFNWRRTTKSSDGSYAYEVVLPPPYGTAYEHEFAKAILKGEGSRIYDYLSATFSGDECDRLYLLRLLDFLETAGFFNDNVGIRWYTGSDGGIEQWEEGPKESIRTLTRNGDSISNLFIGKARNKARADIVRQWIEDKIKVESGCEPAPKEARVKKIENSNGGRAKSANLIKITLPQAKSLFAQARLGAASSPGEWGAALIALSVAGVLVGNPAQIARWFETNVPEGKTTSETLKKIKEYTQPDQFSRDPGEIFKKVLREANLLLSKNKI